jgi:hypothetical protein
MSSTQRSKDTLDTLFADNTSGLITPARLRDFVESAKPSMGGLHFDGPGDPTSIATAETFVKASNETTLQGAYRFSAPADNRLQYDGPEDVAAIVIATLAFTCADDDQVLAFALAINGTVVDASIIRTKIATGADIQAVTIMAHPTLESGDYIEVWVANDTSDADITIDHGHMHVAGYLT